MINEQSENRILSILAGVIITGLALGLRLSDLDVKSLWLDEILQIRIVTLRLSELVPALLRDQHPPLSYLIQKVFALFQMSDFSLRLPSALFGTAAVLAVYYFTARLYGLFAGFIAALFLALNVGAITQAQYVRPYSFLLFFSAWHYGALFCLLTGRSLRRQVSQVILSGVLALYSDTFGVAMLLSAVGIAAGYGLIEKRRGEIDFEQYKKTGKAYLAVFLLYLPWLIPLLLQIQNTATKEISWTLEANAKFFLYLMTYYQFGFFKGYSDLWPLWQLPVVYGSMALGAFWPRKRNPLPLLVGAFMIFIPFAALVISFRFRVFAPRHFIFLLPPAAMLIGRFGDNLVCLTRKWCGERKVWTAAMAAAIVAALGFNAGSNLPNYYNEGHHVEAYKGDWKSVAKALQENVAHDEAVYISQAGFHLPLLDWYLPPEKRLFEIEIADSPEGLAELVARDGKSFALIRAPEQQRFFAALRGKYRLNPRYGLHFPDWSLYFFDHGFDLKTASLAEAIERKIVRVIDPVDGLSFDAAQAAVFTGTIFGPKLVYRNRLTSYNKAGGQVYYYLFNRQAGECKVSFFGASTCASNSVEVTLAADKGRISFPYRNWGKSEITLNCPQGIFGLILTFGDCPAQDIYFLREIAIRRAME